MESALENRTPQSPPPIPPVTGVHRPTWSVMIPVYNCSTYLPITLESVLAQALPEADMQIEVVDDASTDHPVEQLVYEVGRGRVQYFRQPINRGSLHNLNTAIQRARGKYLHILHGDDLVLPGFYREMQNLLEAYPEAGMAFCRYLYIDEAGKPLYPSDPEAEQPGLLIGWLSRLATRQRIQTPAVVVQRKVYEHLGGFYGVHYGEDWLMWLRIAIHYPVAYTPAIRAAYRQHQHSISGRWALNGQNMRDIGYVIHQMKTLLPENIYRTAAPRARHFYAAYAIQTAHRNWHLKAGLKPVLAQLHQACRLHPSVLLQSNSLKLYLKILWNLH